MALFGEDFGGDVVGRSAKRLLPFALVLDFGGETEVSDLDVQFVVEEKIAEFEVAVDYMVLMEVVDAGEDLFHVEACFGFGYDFPAFLEFHHGLEESEVSGWFFGYVGLLTLLRHSSRTM